MYSINTTSPFVNYVPTGTASKKNDAGKVATTWDSSIGRKRYYSSLNAEIYIGSYFIDEIISIQYSVQQNSMPLSGYNSYTYDEVANGSRIVQGQFVINLTRPNYLFDLMKKVNLNKDVVVEKKNGETVTYKQKYTSLERDKRPLFYSEFNIEVMFGKQNSQGDAAFHVLENVSITGSQIALDTTGQPVGEVYSFMAKDIVPIG
ncbi:hypothetical protein [Kurthia sp. Dielmo]|uniref:hypothetical protein n=1 Tax=Kurthia sp. Dielmo TaxID=1033738 RepID=UPI001121011A|nr:hypothetical protein [Kurthia sp. Dielmo]